MVVTHLMMIEFEGLEAERGTRCLHVLEPRMESKDESCAGTLLASGVCRDDGP